MLSHLGPSHKIHSIDLRGYFLFIAIWIFSLEYVLLAVSSPAWDVALKLCGLFGVALLVRPRFRHLQGAAKTCVILFALWLLYPLFPGLLEQPGLNTVQWLKFVIVGTFFLVLMAAEFPWQAKILQAITRGYMVLGVVFAVQAIGGFIALLIDFISPQVVQIARRPMVPMADIGVFGYANALQFPVNGIQLLRPQGWFYEPSLLAAFLIPVIVFILAEYRRYRSMRILLALIMVAIAMFLTLSLAGWFGLLYAFMFLFWFEPVVAFIKRQFFGIKNFFADVMALAFLSGLFFAIAYGYIKTSNWLRGYALSVRGDNGYWQVLGRSFGRDEAGVSGNLFREYYAAGDYLALFSARPFGIGLGHTAGTHELPTANAFLFWLVSSGVGVVLVVVFFLYFFIKFCSPLLRHNEFDSRAIAASMLGVAMHNLSYGTWMAPTFLLLLAAVGIGFASLNRNSNPNCFVNRKVGAG